MTTDKPFALEACVCDKVPVVLRMRAGRVHRRSRALTAQVNCGVARVDHGQTVCIGEVGYEGEDASGVGRGSSVGSVVGPACDEVAEVTRARLPKTRVLGQELSSAI